MASTSEFDLQRPWENGEVKHGGLPAFIPVMLHYQWTLQLQGELPAGAVLPDPVAHDKCAYPAEGGFEKPCIDAKYVQLTVVESGLRHNPHAKAVVRLLYHHQAQQIIDLEG